MAAEIISVADTIKAAQSQLVDSEATAQKASQVATQAQSAAKQAAAAAEDALQDAKAARDKINKELGKIPQKIEDVEDEIIDALRFFLGATPNIKKISITTPDGITYKKPNFDPEKSLENIKKTIDPMLNTAKPLEAVAGNIPLLGDLLALLTAMVMDTSGETDLSEEDLYALCPTPPEMPPSIAEKAEKIVKLTGQAIQYMPIFMIDVIVQILRVIYDMFNQIKSVIGVPPIPFPFTLIDDLVQLVPKVKRLILTTPPEVQDTVEQKLKKKFQYATALSTPKPNLSKPKISVDASSLAIVQSIPPPIDSNISPTPSVPEAEPKEPIKT